MGFQNDISSRLKSLTVMTGLAFDQAVVGDDYADGPVPGPEPGLK
jgi:hypothetical protein